MSKLRTAFLILILFLVACQSQTPLPEEIPGSGPTRGEALFQLNPLGTAPGCITCHALEADAALVGPAMAGIAKTAENQTTGLPAADYLRQSLLEPDLHLAPEFNPGAMPRYGDLLAENDIDDLVAYMLTLK